MAKQIMDIGAPVISAGDPRVVVTRSQLKNKGITEKTRMGATSGHPGYSARRPGGSSTPEPYSKLPEGMGKSKSDGFFKKAGSKIKAGAGKVADVAWRNRSTKGRIGVVAAGTGIVGVGGYYAYRKSRK